LHKNSGLHEKLEVKKPVLFELREVSNKRNERASEYFKTDYDLIKKISENKYVPFV